MAAIAARFRVNATDCMPDRHGAVRARPGELEQVVDRRAQDPSDRVLGEVALGDHRLALPAALEVAMETFLSPPMFASSPPAQLRPARSHA